MENTNISSEYNRRILFLFSSCGKYKKVKVQLLAIERLSSKVVEDSFRMVYILRPRQTAVALRCW